MSEGEIRQGAVDETLESLHAALDAFGFTQTGQATVENSNLYGQRTEASRRHYIGRLFDPGQAQADINRWFEANGPSLPE